MSNNKYGMVDWADVEIKTASPNQARTDLYMRLDSGSNVVRIVTKPHEYMVHRYKTEPTDPGYGERVLSSIAHGRDPLMEKGLKPKRRWLVGVIDRSTASYKILDISSSIFKKIQKYVRDEDWGDPQGYDIDIIVDKEGGPQGYYEVVAKKPKPLTPADLEVRSQADLEELKRKCTPPTPEQVEQKIAAIDAKSKSRKSGKKAVVENAVPVDESDDSVDFPASD